MYMCYFRNKCRLHDSKKTVAKFIVSDWEDKVDSGIGLSYGPAIPASKAGGPV